MAKDSDLGLMAKHPKRTMDQYVEPTHTYEEVHVNEAGEEHTVTVKVYPTEPNPMENVRPAFAYGCH